MFRARYLLILALLSLELVASDRSTRSRDRRDNDFFGFGRRLGFLNGRRSESSRNRNRDIFSDDAGESPFSASRGRSNRGRFRLPSASNILRGVARGLGTGYRGVKAWRGDAAAAFNGVVAQTFDGINYALSIIPYDQIEETAMRMVDYFKTLNATGVPMEAFSQLLQTEAGGPSETIRAIMEADGDREILQPLLMEISQNYRDVYMVTAFEVEHFLEIVTGTRMQLPRQYSDDGTSVEEDEDENQTEETPDSDVETAASSSDARGEAIAPSGGDNGTTVSNNQGEEPAVVES